MSDYVHCSRKYKDVKNVKIRLIEDLKVALEILDSVRQTDGNGKFPFSDFTSYVTPRTLETFE